jgi:hypothetical protein
VKHLADNLWDLRVRLSKKYSRDTRTGKMTEKVLKTTSFYRSHQTRHILDGLITSASCANAVHRLRPLHRNLTGEPRTLD